MKRLMLPNLSVHENSFLGRAGYLPCSGGLLLLRLKALKRDFFFRGGGTGMLDGSPSKRLVTPPEEADFADDVDAGGRLPATLFTALRR